MKNTILGIQLTEWTVKRVSMALKDTKRKQDSWFAGYSTARAETEILPLLKMKSYPRFYAI